MNARYMSQENAQKLYADVGQYYYLKYASSDSQAVVKWRKPRVQKTAKKWPFEFHYFLWYFNIHIMEEPWFQDIKLQQNRLQRFTPKQD